MKGFLILFELAINLLIYQISFGQNLFQIAIGSSYIDAASSIIQSSDGNYIISGDTYFSSKQSFYLIKINPSGNILWSGIAGGTNNIYTGSVIQTIDGGYAGSGFFHLGTSISLYLVKFNSTGLPLSSTMIGPFNAANTASVLQLSNGKYITSGSASWAGGGINFLTVKLDNIGSNSIIWSKSIGGDNSDYANDIKKTSDNGFIIAGHTTSFGAGSNDVYVIKLDSNGSFQWNRTIGGTNIDVAYSIIQTTDNGFLLAGMTESFGAGHNDFYIIKLNNSGALLWTKTIGGANDDRASEVIQTTEGGYAVTGYSNSYGNGTRDMFIVKLNSTGAVQWSRIIGGSDLDMGNSIIQTTDGYIVAGQTLSFGVPYDIYLVKLDHNGNTCGNSNTPNVLINSGGILGNPSPTINNSTPPLISSATPVYGTGATFFSICPSGLENSGNTIPLSTILFQNFPNPFNPKTKIKFSIPPYKENTGNVSIKVFDITGKEIETLVNKTLQPGTYEVVFDGTNYPSGVYFYKLTIINIPDGTTSGGMNNQSPIDYSETKKMLLIK